MLPALFGKCSFRKIGIYLYNPLTADHGILDYIAASTMEYDINFEVERLKGSLSVYEVNRSHF